MAIDWEGLLGASGPGLQRAYDDCVQRAMDELDELYRLENPGFSVSTYENIYPISDELYGDYRDIDESTEDDP